MSKKMLINIGVKYDLSTGELAKEYREWLDDYRDSKNMRKYFVIDRLIGHNQLSKVDKKARVRVTEY